ncbi:MAG: MFS transporter [Planctomycetales bacterium]|nr:MFS transporter [Planctomycetales bacterium]
MHTRPHPSSWQWWVSCLLLLATMINYMDRQTLSNLSVRITDAFELTNEQYGDMEFVFGVAFAFGSLFFGFLADRLSVRWLYPFVLLAWSGVGFATGITNGYHSMLVCRGLLGFFESGHWPCALIVTQSIMASGQRVMGNSILQSGASLGAIVTPIIIRWMVGDSVDENAWRLPFLVIGATGLMWVGLWLLVIRRTDLQTGNQLSEDSQESAASQESQITSSANVSPQSDEPLRWLKDLLVDRRFWALVIMVISINTSWQLVRAWLPKFLQQGRGYSEAQTLYFISVYYIATDVGCILAGVFGLWLIRRGATVHRSRVLTFLGCSVLAGFTTMAAMLPQGWLLMAVLLCVAAGTLGVFPCYYSFTQEISTTSMGRVTGLLSFVGWLASAPTQKVFGIVVDSTGSYDVILAGLGWAPMLGLLAFLVLWPRDTVSATA